MVFLGELEHGLYDECADLPEDKINEFYGFSRNGESTDGDKEPSSNNDSDSELDEDSDHANLGSEHEANLNIAAQNSSESSDDPDSDDGFDTSVRPHFHSRV